MKYSNSNKPLVCMQTNSTCYKKTEKMNIKGVLWHSTGANNPNLKRYVQPNYNDSNYSYLISNIGINVNNNDWNHVSIQAGLNAWIGKLADGSVTTIQTMPWNYRPWGCGSGKIGSCNDGWIQFEICEDSLTDKSYFEDVYKEACELTAYLCTLYNLNPKGTTTINGVSAPVILCHSDSYYLGLGTNHSDIYHWFNKFNKTMDDVRDDVYKLMYRTDDLYRVRKSWDDIKSQIGAYKSLENAKNVCKEAGDSYHVFDSLGGVIYPSFKIYKVKVTADALNIRSGPSTSYSTTGCIKDNGVYTIIEESSGWGKLLSGKGWISLKYTRKV